MLDSSITPVEVGWRLRLVGQIVVRWGLGVERIHM